MVLLCCRPEPEPEVIILRPVERAHHVPKAPEEPEPEHPKFTHPLRDIDIVEGTRAHFEAKVIPIGDATMNIEWFHNGKPLAASKFVLHFFLLDTKTISSKNVNRYIPKLF